MRWNRFFSRTRWEAWLSSSVALQAVEVEIEEGKLDDRSDGPRCEAPTAPRFVDPVAEARAPKRAAGDVRELDHAGERVAVEDPVRVVGGGEPLALGLESEEALGPSGLVWLMRLSVGEQEARQLVGVVGGQRPDCHGAPISYGRSSRTTARSRGSRCDRSARIRAAEQSRRAAEAEVSEAG